MPLYSKGNLYSGSPGRVPSRTGSSSLTRSNSGGSRSGRTGASSAGRVPSRSSGVASGRGTVPRDGRIPPPAKAGRPPYGGKPPYHGGGHHRHVYRPTYNHFYFGPGGFGYGYWGNGFGISIGIPITRYYEYYDVVQPYYVDAYPQPYYTDYAVAGGAPVEIVDDNNANVAPPNADEPLASGPSFIPARGNAANFQAQAEQAFRERRYEDAARLSNHALIEDRGNGKLHLFASQVFFALKDYRSSAAALQLAASMLEPDDWGFVVENFQQFYRGKEYVNQMADLVEFIRDNPDEPYAHLLRGFHYKYLGYDKEARAPLRRAVEIESRDRLAAELLVMAGGELPEGTEQLVPVPAPNDDDQGEPLPAPDDDEAGQDEPLPEPEKKKDDNAKVDVTSGPEEDKPIANEPAEPADDQTKTELNAPSNVDTVEPPVEVAEKGLDAESGASKARVETAKKTKTIDDGKKAALSGDSTKEPSSGP